MKIDKINGTVGYNDELHKYFDIKTGEVYTSVTTLISNYHEHFDGKFWSLYKASESVLTSTVFAKLKKLKDNKTKFYNFISNLDTTTNKLINDKAEQYVILWGNINKESTDKGTKYHNEKEWAVIGSKKSTFLNKEYTYSPDYDLTKLEDTCYVEYLVVDNEYLIAGLIDKLFKTNYIIDIEDYKTNKEIKFNSFKDKKGHRMMLSPISHIQDCNFYHYALQLSLYAYLLERKGVTPRSLTLLWVEDVNKEPHRIPVPYLRKEVIAILEDHKSKK